MTREQLSKGYVQIYTGDGKGKTTAALGLALRAAGHGLHTYIGQFMKAYPYGEVTALQDHPYITLEQYGSTCCLLHKSDVKPEDIEKAQQGLKKAKEAMLSKAYNIIILDELNIALWFEVLEMEDVMTFLDARPEQVELVLTGRFAPQELIERADLVTEMREVKHYYQQGVLTRKGIEN